MTGGIPDFYGHLSGIALPTTVRLEFCYMGYRSTSELCCNLPVSSHNCSLENVERETFDAPKRLVSMRRAGESAQKVRIYRVQSCACRVVVLAFLVSSNPRAGIGRDQNVPVVSV